MIYKTITAVVVLLAFSCCSKENLLKTYKLQETLKDFKKRFALYSKKKKTQQFVTLDTISGDSISN
jgi:hypothetical protein